MTCLVCGGLFVPYPEMSDYGPIMIDKCVGCARMPGEKPRWEDSEDRGRKNRARCQEVLLGWKTTDYPLEEERIGDVENDKEVPSYRKGNGKILKKKETLVGRKTQSDLAVVRHDRLKILSDRFGGPFRPSKKYPDLSDPTLGKVLSDKYTMGYRLARKIEQTVGLPSGWMDGDTPADLPGVVELAGQKDRPEKSTKREKKGSRIRPQPPGPGENALPAQEEEISDTPPLIIHERTSTIPSRSLQETLSSLTMNPRVLQVALVIVTLSEAP